MCDIWALYVHPGAKLVVIGALMLHFCAGLSMISRLTFRQALQLSTCAAHLARIVPFE